jgi:hypothetical protein
MAGDWLLGRRYSLMLLALGLLFILEPLLHKIELGQWVYDLFITLLYLASFRLLFRWKSFRLASVLLGAPTVLAVWTGYVIPGIPPAPLAAAFHVFGALYLGFAVAAILQDTHEATAVSADTLAGAFCGYLLTGAVFGHLFCVLELVSPGSFRASADLAALLVTVQHRRYLLMYYSFMTLTTVGYGDIIPASPPARSLACLEALLGQFYIAVVMAELIGLKVSRPAGAPPRAPDDT